MSINGTSTPDDEINLASSEVTIKDCPFPLKCCGNKLMRLKFDDATGFQLLFMANGPVVVSNAFLAASLITLAKIAAGCDNLDACDNKVYGFKPSSLITIISAISGLLAAFLLPFIGAMVDFTSRRRQVGMVTAAVMMLIQAIQIGTVQATWFPMAILQAINGFLFQALRLATFSYLPEIKRVVGEDQMPAYSSRFYVWFYGDQFLYTATVFVISTVLKAGDVKTGQIGQAVNVVMSGFFYILAFYFFTDKEPRRQLPEGSSLVSAGFKQMFSTAKGIVKYYPTTLTRFFLGVLFSRAATVTLISFAVVFLVEVLQLNGRVSGIIFALVLFSTIPGSFCAKFLMRKMDPIRCMQICLVTLIASLFAGFLIMSGPERGQLIYVFSAIWGFALGWFYPAEVTIYSSLMPMGQEAELAGFYLYCNMIFTFLPPLIITLMNENGISLNWGGVHLSIYLFLSLICYSLMPSWTECLEIAGGENKMLNNENRESDEESSIEDFKNNEIQL